MNRKIEKFRQSSREVIESAIDTTKSVVKKVGAENAAIGTAISGGAAATVAGVVAAGTSTAAAISSYSKVF